MKFLQNLAAFVLICGAMLLLLWIAAGGALTWLWFMGVDLT